MEALPFIPDQEYRRRDIHIQYGGNRQAGICPSSTHPFIFIFTGKTGDQHGYKDMWENDFIFSYTGEGQSGDMQFIRGNLALRDHIKDGKRIFLFQQSSKGYVHFLSEMTLFDFGPFETHDTLGNSRLGIKFFLKKKGVHVPYQLSDLNDVAEPSLQYLKPNITEYSGLVVSRVGQGAYRKSIINRWENKCAVTRFNDSRILIASHIHPWKNATDDERLDVDNGILLSPTYDALFDKHLITFNNDGKIVVTESIESEALRKIGVLGNEKITNLSSGNLTYLSRHQEMFQLRLDKPR